MPSVRYPDPFAAVLLTSEPLAVTNEQKNYIREILETACSDSRFADKAYIAIMLVLTGQKTVPPVVNSLVPNSVAIGQPSFDIHVMGTGFTPTSVIVFNGYDEPTTFVSETELTTGINMDVWTAPSAPLPVHVRNADGVLSDPQTFTFTEVGGSTFSTQSQKNKKYEQLEVKDEKEIKEHKDKK